MIAASSGLSWKSGMTSFARAMNSSTARNAATAYGGSEDESSARGDGVLLLTCDPQGLTRGDEHFEGRCSGQE